ncbi:MAG: DUF4838 domain-containing protein, partial [Planctomycetia bacterium]|nr:DUF4838 domain-containing protein [Planctomycetia bacterium]
DAPVKRLEKAAPESFLLQSSARRLLILGRDDAGASHGVYTVLRDLGCRWFFLTADWEVVPRMADVAVKADRVEGPALRVRILSNGAGSGASARLFETWCRRNRLGSAYGGQAVHHSYASYVPKSLFKEHPDWFAWVSTDGLGKGTEQNGEQPCTTHPEVVKRVKEGVLADLRRKRDATGEPPAIVSVSPNDGTPNMCRCDRCMAAGTYGDCALLLANQAAEAIAAEFPATLVGFLAYGRASTLPVKVRTAHPNVLASVATSFNGGTSVPRLIEEWPKIVRHVTIYDYYAIGAWGSKQPDNTQPTVASISRSLRSWHARGIEGVNGEMENDWGSCGHRFWAFAECAWNPAVDPAAAMDDFLSRCWGRAAGPMRRYYSRWENGEKATPRVLRLAMADLEEAARTAEAPEVVRRVDQLSLYLHWLLLNRAFQEATDDDAKNRIAVEGDLFQYRWRESFMVQFTPALFSVDRPARIGFRPEEVASLRAETVERFLSGSGPPIELRTVPPTADLGQPSPDSAPRPAADAGRLEDFFAEASYLFRATAGETVQVVFRPEPPSAKAAAASTKPSEPPADGLDPIPMDVAGEEASAEKMGRFQVWYLGPDGLAEDYCLENNPPDPAGRPLQLDFKPARDGLYRLNARVRKGGVHADFEARPHVIAAGLKESRSLLRFHKTTDAAPAGDTRKGLAATFFFFVPTGTRAFTIEASCPGRKQVMAAVEPLGAGSGGTAANAAAAADPVPIDAAGERVIEVPAGGDGRIWRLRLDASHVRLGLGGIPAFVATSPELLLVPRDAVRGRTR